MAEESGISKEQVTELAKLMLGIENKSKLGFTRELVASVLQSEQMAGYYRTIEVTPVTLIDVEQSHTQKARGGIYRWFVKTKYAAVF